MTPEGRVKAGIKKVLDDYGFWRAGAKRPERVVGWYYMPVNNGMGVSGIPDFVGMWLGKFFAVEAKAPGGKTTQNQDRRHEEIRSGRGIVLVIDDPQQLKEFLDAGYS